MEPVEAEAKASEGQIRDGGGGWDRMDPRATGVELDGKFN